MGCARARDSGSRSASRLRSIAWVRLVPHGLPACAIIDHADYMATVYVHKTKPRPDARNQRAVSNGLRKGLIAKRQARSIAVMQSPGFQHWSAFARISIQLLSIYVAFCRSGRSCHLPAPECPKRVLSWRKKTRVWVEFGWQEKSRGPSASCGVRTAYTAEIPTAMIFLFVTVLRRRRFHEDAIPSVTFTA